MARLQFSKIRKKYSNYKKYQCWLEKNSFPKFCGYSWLIDQSSLSIDHYKPREHYPELESHPDNLILCTSTCNSSKQDYCPEARDRKIYKNFNYRIFNYREEDIGKYVTLVKEDGSLKYKSNSCKERFHFNEKIFKFNRPHNKDVRQRYIKHLEALVRMYKLLHSAKKKADAGYIREFEKLLSGMKGRLL